MGIIPTRMFVRYVRYRTKQRLGLHFVCHTIDNRTYGYVLLSMVIHSMYASWVAFDLIFYNIAIIHSYIIIQNYIVV